MPLDCDWWLLDDERVIQMHYTADGRMDGKELVIESGVVELTVNGGTWQSVTPSRRKR